MAKNEYNRIMDKLEQQSTKMSEIHTEVQVINTKFEIARETNKKNLEKDIEEKKTIHQRINVIEKKQVELKNQVTYIISIFGFIGAGLLMLKDNIIEFFMSFR